MIKLNAKKISLSLAHRLNEKKVFAKSAPNTDHLSTAEAGRNITPSYKRSK
jgi:hypothetical protein